MAARLEVQMPQPSFVKDNKGYIHVNVRNLCILLQGLYLNFFVENYNFVV